MEDEITVLRRDLATYRKRARRQDVRARLVMLIATVVVVVLAWLLWVQ